MDVPEPLALEAAERAAELGALLSDDAQTEVSVGAVTVSFVAELGRHVEYECDGEAVEPTGQGDEGSSGFGLDVGCVDDGEASGGESFGGDEVEDLEGVVGGGLVVFIVGDESAAVVGGEYFRGLEVFMREGGLSGAGGADEGDEGEFGDASQKICFYASWVARSSYQEVLQA